MQACGGRYWLYTHTSFVHLDIVSTTAGSRWKAIQSGNNHDDTRNPVSLALVPFDSLISFNSANLDALHADVLTARDRRRSSSQANDSRPHEDEAPPKKPRFRFAPSFRLRSKKKYDKIEEQRGLLSSRRESADSDETMADTDETASDLLVVLAPLVSSLQHLSLRLTSAAPCATDAVFHDFVALCDLLDGFIAELQSGSPEEDDHDFEMRALMLSALSKKVHAEQDSARRSSMTASPLVVKPSNPFVLHATSIRKSSTKAIASAKSIPSAVGGSPPPPYSSFVGGAQTSSWAKNVIRLGSFQNSALFTPSPVAVRRLIGGKLKAGNA